MNPTLAKAAANLKRRAARHGKARCLPALWLMTDEKRLADPEKAVAALPRGAGVIFRHYGAKNRAALAARLAAVCRRRGVVLLVAGDGALAARINAAGVHLPDHLSRGGPPPAVRLCQRNGKFVMTASAHDARGVRRAYALKAAAVFLAPVFATASHPGRRPLGAARFSAIARKAPLPVFALGGVSAATVNALRESGCAGVAGIGFAAKT